MNRRKHVAVLLIILVVLFCGCVSRLNITYNSDPPGAVLYSGDQRFGYTPQTLQYAITKEDRKRGYKSLQGTSVRWASGASANIESLRSDLGIGLNQVFMFKRPETYPGYEVDAKFALELEKLNVMRQQAQAQERQAQAQEQQAQAQRRQAQAQEQEARTPKAESHIYPAQAIQQKRCTSTVVGNTVYTTCD
jgi:hypothetical protein